MLPLFSFSLLFPHFSSVYLFIFRSDLRRALCFDAEISSVRLIFTKPAYFHTRNAQFWINIHTPFYDPMFFPWAAEPTVLCFQLFFSFSRYFFQFYPTYWNILFLCTAAPSVPRRQSRCCPEQSLPAPRPSSLVAPTGKMWYDIGIRRAVNPQKRSGSILCWRWVRSGREDILCTPKPWW